MRRRHPTHSDAASSKDFFGLKKFRSRHYICRRSIKASIPVFQTGDGVSGSLACSIRGYTQAVEEVCLENTQGCKSLRGFESSYPRGITEKPSRGDAVFTNFTFCQRVCFLFFIPNLLSCIVIVYSLILCGCNSTVESQPSKLFMWVRFPSFAPMIWSFSSVGRAQD